MIPDRRVHFVSLGCPKNRGRRRAHVGDSRGQGLAGCRRTRPPRRSWQHCAFIDESKEESVDAILEMAEYKDHGRCRALVVSGCLAQRYADQLAEESRGGLLLRDRRVRQNL